MYNFQNSHILENMGKMQSYASVILITFSLKFKQITCMKTFQARSKGGGEDFPPARLQQVQFALNRKHAFFDAMP